MQGANCRIRGDTIYATPVTTSCWHGMVLTALTVARIQYKERLRFKR